MRMDGNRSRVKSIKGSMIMNRSKQCTRWHIVDTAAQLTPIDLFLLTIRYHLLRTFICALSVFRSKNSRLSSRKYVPSTFPYTDTCTSLDYRNYLLRVLHRLSHTYTFTTLLYICVPVTLLSYTVLKQTRYFLQIELNSI